MRNKFQNLNLIRNIHKLYFKCCPTFDRFSWMLMVHTAQGKLWHWNIPGYNRSTGKKYKTCSKLSKCFGIECLTKKLNRKQDMYVCRYCFLVNEISSKQKRASFSSNLLPWNSSSIARTYLNVCIYAALYVLIYKQDVHKLSLQFQKFVSR